MTAGRKPDLSDDRGHGSGIIKSAVIAASFTGGGVAAYYGGRWILDNITTFRTVGDLSYLNEGLKSPGIPRWWEVAGVKEASEKATIRQELINQVKHFEEMLGGIPRTFGLFGPLSKGLLSTPETSLRLTPEMLEGAESYYGRLLSEHGDQLTELDKVRGLHVGPYDGKTGLFRLDEFGVPHSTPIVENVSIRARRWAIDDPRLMDYSHGGASGVKSGAVGGGYGGASGVKSGAVGGGYGSASGAQSGAVGGGYGGAGGVQSGGRSDGRLLHQQFTRDAEMLAEDIGAYPVSRANKSPFIVEAAPTRVKIRGPARSILEEFTDVSRVEDFLTQRTSPEARSAMREAGMYAKSNVERYMKVLDNPLEFVEDVTKGLTGGKAPAALTAAKESKSYGFFKNIFGAGGDYSGTATEVLTRHAGRVAGIGLALAATYEGVSMVTNFLFDRNAMQMGGEVAAAGERLVARTSDFTGLTALNKAQEKKAEGSGSLAAVLSFPLSGFITGYIGAGLVTRAQGIGLPNAGIENWKNVRALTHEAPAFLAPAKKIPLLGGILEGPMTVGKRWGLAGAAIGAALSLPFLLGSLGSSQSYDEVVAEQSGDTEVAVKKGAYWEAGRTPYEGDKTMYFRPGWYRRLMDDPGGELQYGDLNDRPLSRIIKGIVDPYWKEKEFYYDRPYPVTGPDTDVGGFLGPIWGATIGRVLKPVAYMHLNELSAAGDLSSVQEGEGVIDGLVEKELPSEDLGGRGLSKISTQYDVSQTANDVLATYKDAIGLRGFGAEAIYKKVTGDTAGFHSTEPRYASASSIGSLNKRFWDLGLGGGGGTTEGIRRFLPKKPFMQSDVNPIRNTMPDWLPGPGSFTDFQHGDPYGKIQDGEYRLPGSGYATRYKELEGVDPADYSAKHRMRILADVAPYSDELKQTMREVKGSNDPGDQEAYAATVAQLEEKEKRIRFTKPGGDSGLIGGYWGLLKNVGRINPAEHIIPFSPVHKFAGPVDALSTYKDREVYSTANPDWARPIDDFIAPAIRSAGRMAGIAPVPGATQEKRDLTGYLDKVTWLKNKKMAKAARERGDGGAAVQYERSADFTMFGMDPYSEMLAIEKVLPQGERPYFREFVAEDDPDKRTEILSMVPKYTRKFYLAQWQKKRYAELASKGELTSNEVDTVKHIEAARAMEGQAATTDDWDVYQDLVADQQVKENSFADFVRSREASRYFATEAPYEAPPSDWVGYDERIAMPDVKLKVIQNAGKDFHDFGLWDDRAQSVSRKPYIEEAADELMRSNGETRESIYRSLTSRGFTDLSVDVVNTGARDSIIFDMNQDRRVEIDRQLERNGFRRGL